MEWKVIIGNKHEVSEDGRVRNIKTKRELKPDLSGGYKRVLIIVDGTRTHQSIHRLVATAFCENKNPKEFTIVNHIDENKENNHSSNLEWVSPKKNSIHGTAMERRVHSTRKTKSKPKEPILLDGEIWIDAPVEGYQISNYGRCRGKRGILKLEQHTSGYLRVSFSNKGRFYVHRLIAEHFIENPLCLKIVNHKDGDKTNNKIDNLEWVTASENSYHYHKNKIK